MSIRIDGTNTTANPGITGTDTDTGLQFGTDEVKVVTGGSDRVTVDSSGRLLVGTSSDTTGDTGAKVQIVDTGTPVLALSRNDTSITSGNTIGQIRIFSNDDSGYQECARIAAQADGTFANNDKPTRLVFSTTADGASSPTERMRILSSGGITFNGDTAAANALDDYEEGTFTPIWTTTGTDFSSVTYTNQDGTYTKIGNIVHVSIRLRSSASSGGSGNLLVGGLPFDCNDSAGSGGGSPATYYIDYHNSTINVATETRVNNNQFYLLSSLDNASWSNVSSGGLQGSGVSEIRVSFDYITDS